jgi:hypothetical protein
MEAVMDKVVAELQTLIETESADGGISDILDVEAVYWGDPYILPANTYPTITVSPVRDEPKSETTGYDVRDLNILINVLIDLRQYFEADTDEADGDRKLTQAADAVNAWFRRKSNRTLDGLEGVRDVRVSTTDYQYQPRGAVLAKGAQIALTVNRQRQRQS